MDSTGWSKLAARLTLLRDIWCRQTSWLVEVLIETLPRSTALPATSVDLKLKDGRLNTLPAKKDKQEVAVRLACGPEMCLFAAYFSKVWTTGTIFRRLHLSLSFPLRFFQTKPSVTL
jgi:hypothetical protein